MPVAWQEGGAGTELKRVIHKPTETVLHAGNRASISQAFHHRGVAENRYKMMRPVGKTWER
jgi:hypothetical protein